MTRVTSVLMLAVLAASAGAAEPGSSPSSDSSLISFKDPTGQSPDKLSSRWKALPPESRKDIEHFLLLRLGLSSTGKIALIGVYRAESKDEQNKNHGALFHFRQLDLFGSRLFWTVLIDPEAQSAQVLYHINRKDITGKPIGIGAEARNEER